MPTNWYSYEVIDDEGLTTYVTMNESDIIKKMKTIQPELSDFAALEVFVSRRKARKTRMPEYLTVKRPGKLLKTHIESLGTNGLAEFAKRHNITEKALKIMMEKNDSVLFPTHILKAIGLKRDVAVYLIDKDQ